VSIQELSAEEFRRRIAGLVDPDKEMDPEDKAVLMEEAVNWGWILASLFGEDLDRKTLWERIGNGFVVAVAKCAGDFEQFVEECLTYVKASPGRVAASSELDDWLQRVTEKPIEWRQQFLRVMEKRHYIVIVKARSVWQVMKVSKTPVVLDTGGEA